MAYNYLIDCYTTGCKRRSLYQPILNLFGAVGGRLYRLVLPLGVCAECREHKRIDEFLGVQAWDKIVKAAHDRQHPVPVLDRSELSWSRLRINALLGDIKWT